jgi:hypothetical protein
MTTPKNNTGRNNPTVQDKSRTEVVFDAAQREQTDEEEPLNQQLTSAAPLGIQKTLSATVDEPRANTNRPQEQANTETKGRYRRRSHFGVWLRE